MGKPESVSRILILHNNVANVLTRLTSAIGNTGINIANMNSKSKGPRAVSIFDLDSPVPEEILERMRKSEQIIRVRVIK